jgi:hypothetical protein
LCFLVRDASGLWCVTCIFDSLCTLRFASHCVFLSRPSHPSPSPRCLDRKIRTASAADGSPTTPAREQSAVRARCSGRGWLLSTPSPWRQREVRSYAVSLHFSFLESSGISFCPLIPIAFEFLSIIRSFRVHQPPRSSKLFASADVANMPGLFYSCRHEYKLRRMPIDPERVLTMCGSS